MIGKFSRCLPFAPCKGIRIPESRIFLLVESGILGFGIRNPAVRIRNPTKDWNPEFNLLKIHSGLNCATRSKEKPSVYGKPNIGISGVKTIVHGFHTEGRGHGHMIKILIYRFSQG